MNGVLVQATVPLVRLAVVGTPALAVWWVLDPLSNARLPGSGPLLAAAALLSVAGRRR